MTKILRKINQYARAGINFLIRLILAGVYFVLLFPFAIFVKFGRDFLRIKQKSPAWIPQKEIEDIKKFLSRQ